MPNQNSVDQNYRGSFHYRGIRPPGEPGFRPGEVGIHPAFRPDYGQQNVYYREIVNSNQSIRQNNGLPHHISRQGYAFSQRNPPQFLPPRQVGPFNKRFTPRHDRSWKPRQAYTQVMSRTVLNEKPSAATQMIASARQEVILPEKNY